MTPHYRLSFQSSLTRYVFISMIKRTPATPSEKNPTRLCKLVGIVSSLSTPNKAVKTASLGSRPFLVALQPPRTSHFAGHLQPSDTFWCRARFIHDIISFVLEIGLLLLPKEEYAKTRHQRGELVGDVLQRFGFFFECIDQPRLKIYCSFWDGERRNLLEIAK